MDHTDAQDAAHWEAVEEATELLQEGEFHEALLKLRDIVKADPRNPYAYYYTATALFEVGQFEASAAAYRAAVKLAPRYRGARVGLSHALRILEEHRAAIAEAREALKLSPGDGDALYALGLAQASSGDKVAAKRTLEAFLETHPEFEVATEARSLLAKLEGGSSENDNNDD